MYLINLSFHFTCYTWSKSNHGHLHSLLQLKIKIFKILNRSESHIKCELHSTAYKTRNINESEASSGILVKSRKITGNSRL